MVKSNVIPPIVTVERPSIEKIMMWQKTTEKLNALKRKEKAMREAIVAGYFAEREEGTNDFDLEDDAGHVLKCKQGVTRSIDAEALAKIQADQVREGANVPSLPLDDLIKWKPSLSKAAYDKLNPAQRAVFDACIVSKDGLPSLDLVIPAN